MCKEQVSSLIFCTCTVLRIPAEPVKNLMESFDGAEQPPEKKLKRSDAFLIEGDAEVAAREEAETQEALEFYAGLKHFNVAPPEKAEGPLVETPVPPEKVEGPSREVVETPPAAELQTKDESMVEENEEDKENKKREVHRANSRAWHAKWVKKGVPRDAREYEEIPASQPETAVCRDMRTACQEFVSRWIATSDMPPSNDRRNAAYKAWRESPERAALLAARAAVQV